MTENVVKLNCPHCGAPVHVSTASGPTTTCTYCGTSLAIRRSQGSFQLSEIGESLARVQSGTDKTAAELALRRLNEELGVLRETRAEQVESDRLAAQALKHQAARNFAGVGCFGFLVLIFGMGILNTRVGGDGRINVGPFVFLAGAIVATMVTLARGRRSRRAVRTLEGEAQQRVAEIDGRIAELEERAARNRAIADA